MDGSNALEGTNGILIFTGLKKGGGWWAFFLAGFWEWMDIGVWWDGVWGRGGGRRHLVLVRHLGGWDGMGLDIWRDGRGFGGGLNFVYY